jgi:acyl transferase domain-containing protein/acyl carrier protein
MNSAAAGVEPIAVVGVSCRLPGGVRTLKQLHTTLVEGRDLVAQYPNRPWDDLSWFDPGGGVGRSYQNAGSFLDEVARFDPTVFGISTREALEIDPQQRLLLELLWEVSDNAALSLSELRGTQTGTFIGLLASDYTSVHIRDRGVGNVGPYYASGKESSFASGRLSHVMQFTGPALTVSTACSSSLASVHLAASALRNHECDRAVAGGVSLILSAELSIFLAQIGALSRTDRCRAFDARADGIVRGEGAALVMLKRWSDAQRDGDRIIALVVGSAMSHAGWSSGLTVPTQVGQVAAMRSALRQAGVDPQQVSYVEAHGTGTPLGDPIELCAIEAVYGASSGRTTPVYVGSHKASFGHLDAAAGIVGLLKAVAVMRYGEVPPQLHFANGNPLFEWAESPLRIAQGEPALLDTEGSVHAAVSAFGLSGSNVHVVLRSDGTSMYDNSDVHDRLDSAVDDGPVALLVGAFTLAALQTEVEATREKIQAKHPLRGLESALCLTGATYPFRHAIVCVGSTTVEFASMPNEDNQVIVVLPRRGLELDSDGSVPGWVPQKWRRRVLELDSDGSLPGWVPQKWRRRVLGHDDVVEFTLSVCAALDLDVQIRDVSNADVDATEISAAELVRSSRTTGTYAASLVSAIFAAGATGRFELLCGVPRFECPVLAPRIWGGETLWFDSTGSELTRVVDPLRNTTVRAAQHRPSHSNKRIVTTAVGESGLLLGGVEPHLPAQFDGVMRPAGVDLCEALEFVLECVTSLLGAGTPVRAQQQFFDVGLDSVMAAELAARVNTRFSIGIRVHEVITAVNGRGLASMIVLAVAQNDPATPVGRQGESETVPAQNTKSSVPRSEQPDSGERDVQIVGMAVRLPGGVETPSDFWQFLVDERDAITDVGEKRLQRWRTDGSLPTSHAMLKREGLFRGGYLEDIEGFDHRFFRMSGREARELDPQHRLLLELAWEGLEDAHIDPTLVQSERVGVFIGLNSNDYSQVLTRDPSRVSMAFGTGVSPAAASGRISYLFGFEGAAITVDTACSSGLVAVSQAVSAIRAGVLDIAVVGAANLMVTPTINLAAAEGGALANDGRCKAFSRMADGYGRGEGGVVLVLTASGFRSVRAPYCAIVGVAVNQDGSGAGFTVPNGAAQTALIRSALGDSGLNGSAVEMLEAHGTGTRLGDPIEVQAAVAALRPGASGAPALEIGTAKSNFGHLEAAAGMVGLAKAALSVHYGLIPKSLHAEDPSPEIDWSEGRVRVANGANRFSSDSRVAGVSAFGFTGTNAHVILRGRSTPAPAVDSAEPAVLTLSSRNSAGLKLRAQAILTALETEPSKTDESSVTRAHQLGSHSFGSLLLPHRLVVAGRSTASLASSLKSFIRDEQTVDVRPLVFEEPTVGPAFVFSGYGSQWEKMAQHVEASDPMFARHLDHVSEALAQFCGWSVADAIRNGVAVSGAVPQEFLFAVQIAIAKSMIDRGVVPSAVIGHSMGEPAAAHIAGVLHLDDAARLLVERCRVLAQIIGSGAMAVVGLPANDVEELLQSMGEHGVCVAVENSPTFTVISGDSTKIRALVDQFRARKLFSKVVPADGAGHSCVLDPFLPDFETAIRPVNPRNGSVPLYSSTTGSFLPGDSLDTQFWVANLRQPVKFRQAISALYASGTNLFLEISPKPLLLQSIQQCCAGPVVVLGTLESEGMWSESLLPSVRALAAVHEPTAQSVANHSQIRTATGIRPTELHYQWERSPHWLDGVASGPATIDLGGIATRISRICASRTFLTSTFENCRDPELCRTLPIWLRHAIAAALDAPEIEIELTVLEPIRLTSSELELVVSVDTTARNFELSSTLSSANPQLVVHARGKITVPETDITGVFGRQQSQDRSTPEGLVAEEPHGLYTPRWAPICGSEDAPNAACPRLAQLVVIVDLISPDLITEVLGAAEAVCRAVEQRTAMRFIVTHDETKSVVNPIAAMARSVSVEHPELFCGYSAFEGNSTDATELSSKGAFQFVDSNRNEFVLRLVSAPARSSIPAMNQVGEVSSAQTDLRTLHLSTELPDESVSGFSTQGLAEYLTAAHSFIQRAFSSAEASTIQPTQPTNLVLVGSASTVIGLQGSFQRMLTEAFVCFELRRFATAKGSTVRFHSVLGMERSTVELDGLSRASGVEPTDSQTLAQLAQAQADSTVDTLLVLDVHPQLFFDWYRTTGNVAFAACLADTTGENESLLASQLRDRPLPVGLEIMVTLVVTAIATVLGERPSDISPTDGFFQLGMTSTMAMELRTILAQKTGVVLGATDAFRFPTSASLAQHLLEQLGCEGSETLRPTDLSGSSSATSAGGSASVQTTFAAGGARDMANTSQDETARILADARALLSRL